LMDKNLRTSDMISKLVKAINEAYDYMWILNYEEAYNGLSKAFIEITKNLGVDEKEIFAVKRVLKDMLKATARKHHEALIEDLEKLYDDLQGIFRIKGLAKTLALAWTIIKAYDILQSLRRLSKINLAEKIDRLQCYIEEYEDIFMYEARCLSNKNLAISNEEFLTKVEKRVEKLFVKAFNGKSKPKVKVHIAPKHAIDINVWIPYLTYKITIINNRILANLYGMIIPEEAKERLMKFLSNSIALLEQLKMLK